MKKKGVIIPLLMTLVLASVLFLQIQEGSYDNDSTGVYDAESNKPAQKSDGVIVEDSYKSYSYVIDTASFDIDNDGTVENCTISMGPTSGLFTVVITASTDEGIKYKNTFCLNSCGIKFCQENGTTKVLLNSQDYETAAKTGNIYDISVKDHCIVIENADEYVTYWGDAEWNWNLK